MEAFSSGASGSSCRGQRGKLKQTSGVSHYYLFGVQALSITAVVSLLVRAAHLPASLHPTFPAQWSTFHERHLKVGLNGLIFPMMPRRRSLTLMLCALLPPALPVLYVTKARGWREWDKTTLLISHRHFFVVILAGTGGVWITAHNTLQQNVS